MNGIAPPGYGAKMSVRLRSAKLQVLVLLGKHGQRLVVVVQREVLPLVKAHAHRGVRKASDGLLRRLLKERLVYRSSKMNFILTVKEDFAEYSYKR